MNGALMEGFLYRDQLQPVVWLNPDGTTKATLVYSDSPNVPEYMAQGTTTYRLITDQVGSVRLVQNTSTGAVAERIDYDEFGNVLSDSAPGFQPFGFGGGLRDVDTELTRFGARDYDPVTGRWTAKDPLRFGGGLNFYQYNGGDPVNGNDPSGLYAGPPVIVVPPWAGVAWSFYFGWKFGSALEPYTEPWVQKHLDQWFGPHDEPAPPTQCGGSSDGDGAGPDDNRRDCDGQYATDLATCRGVSRRRGSQAGTRCFGSAMQRKVACERGFPLPPLDVWNN